MKKQMKNKELVEIKGGTSDPNNDSEEYSVCTHCGMSFPKSEIKYHKCATLVIPD